MTRVLCLVPFCKRGTSKVCDDFICGNHWPLTDRKVRRMFFRAKRRQRWRAHHRLWSILKRQAIERAGGIS